MIHRTATAETEEKQNEDVEEKGCEWCKDPSTHRIKYKTYQAGKIVFSWRYLCESCYHSYITPECPECHGTNIHFDYNRLEKACRSCGLVIEELYITDEADKGHSLNGTSNNELFFEVMELLDKYTGYWFMNGTSTINFHVNQKIFTINAYTFIYFYNNLINSRNSFS